MTPEEKQAVADSAWIAVDAAAQAADAEGWKNSELNAAWSRAYDAAVVAEQAANPDAEFITGASGGTGLDPASTPTPTSADPGYVRPTGRPVGDQPISNEDTPATTLAAASAAEDAAYEAGVAGGWTKALSDDYNRARDAEIAAIEAAATAIASERLPMLDGGEPSTIPGSINTGTPPATGSSYLDFLARKHQGLLGLFGGGSRTQPAEPDTAATDDTGGSTWVDYGDSGGSSWASGDGAAPANPYGPDDAMREGGLHAGRMGEALRGWMGAPQPYMPGQDQASGGYRTPAYAEGGASVDSFGSPTPAYAPSGEGRYPPWPGAYQTRQAMTGAGGGTTHTMPDGSTMAGPPMGGGYGGGAPATGTIPPDVRARIAAAYAQGRRSPPRAGPLPAGVRVSGRTEVHRGGRNNRRGR